MTMVGEGKLSDKALGLLCARLWDLESNPWDIKKRERKKSKPTAMSYKGNTGKVNLWIYCCLYSDLIVKACLFLCLFKTIPANLLIRSFRTNIMHKVMELEKSGQRKASSFPQNYILATRKVHNTFYKTV